MYCHISYAGLRIGTRRDNMKKSYRQQKKSIREVDTGKSHSGESSPYWNFLESKRRTDSETWGEENVFANPDLMSEDDSLYHRPLSAEGEVQLEIIQEVTKELSIPQQRVLYLCGQLGMSQTEAARELKISHQAVNEVLRRVQRYIRKRYEEIRAKKVD